MSLAGQAFRLLKTDWDSSQFLAEEMYLILLTDLDPTLGPTSVARPGEDNTQLPPELSEWPFPELNFPAFDFPIWPDNPYDIEEESEDTPSQEGQSFFYKRERRTVATQHERTVVPGKVTAHSGSGRYEVTLYPNSSQAPNRPRTVVLPGGDATTVQEPSGSVPVTNVKQLDGSTEVAVDTFALIFRHTEFEITKIEQVQTGGGKPEKVLSTSTEVRVVTREHEMAAAVPAGGGGVPVVIVSGGPGATYLATAYPNGLSAASMTVTVTVLQIDPTETIPAGTWYIAAKIGEDYFIQPPIWIAG